MGTAVCGGAMLQCSFGVAPSTLMVLPLNRTVTTPMPLATIMDFIPMMNILPFGMCQTMSNPQVAASTAAKMGVFTPMPCIPVTVSPWLPGAPTTLIGAFPALTSDSKCMCAWGGVISITSPGQATVQVT